MSVGEVGGRRASEAKWEKVGIHSLPSNTPVARSTSQAHELAHDGESRQEERLPMLVLVLGPGEERRGLRERCPAWPKGTQGSRSEPMEASHRYNDRG